MSIMRGQPMDGKPEKRKMTAQEKRAQREAFWKKDFFAARYKWYDKLPVTVNFMNWFIAVVLALIAVCLVIGIIL